MLAHDKALPYRYAIDKKRDKNILTGLEQQLNLEFFGTTWKSGNLPLYTLWLLY